MLTLGIGSFDDTRPGTASGDDETGECCLDAILRSANSLTRR